jgi:hypothetical protein
MLLLMLAYINEVLLTKETQRLVIVHDGFLFTICTSSDVFVYHNSNDVRDVMLLMTKGNRQNYTWTD